MNDTAQPEESARAKPESPRSSKVTVRVNLVRSTADRRARAMDDWMERVAARLLAGGPSNDPPAQG